MITRGERGGVLRTVSAKSFKTKEILRQRAKERWRRNLEGGQGGEEGRQ